ncbi:hypothetical protein FF38_03419 [Lucilia cuprina]|uniref:Uncharacterized protein n=1 Tax=Lucilia cuprina TaxID=7375 RepID=A0A0L0BZC6_LUCCU|nr:hypothetical protein FF38_03419 [Lucilia cuprina]
MIRTLYLKDDQEQVVSKDSRDLQYIFEARSQRIEEHRSPLSTAYATTCTSSTYMWLRRMSEAAGFDFSQDLANSRSIEYYSDLCGSTIGFYHRMVETEKVQYDEMARYEYHRGIPAGKATKLQTYHNCCGMWLTGTQFHSLGLNDTDVTLVQAEVLPVNPTEDLVAFPSSFDDEWGFITGALLGFGFGGVYLQLRNLLGVRIL